MIYSMLYLVLETHIEDLITLLVSHGYFGMWVSVQSCNDLQNMGLEDTTARDGDTEGKCS